MRKTLILVAMIIAACSTPAESVCDNIGACEQAGSTDFIKSCQDDAKALTTSGDECAGFFLVYYRCADDHFECHGATASFPGCEAKRANVDECLARQALTSACGQLAKRTARCAAVDAGVPVAPVGCTAPRECAARCYLDHVVDPCAPAPDEIAATTACADTCLP